MATRAMRFAPTPRDVTPSAEDVQVTKEMIKAADILDIELLDHLVCGNTLNSYTSLKERGLGFDQASDRVRPQLKRRRRCNAM